MAGGQGRNGAQERKGGLEDGPGQKEDNAHNVRNDEQDIPSKDDSVRIGHGDPLILKGDVPSLRPKPGE
jgi:hypothetical protein